MIPRFHDPDQTAALDRDGYVVFPGLYADDVPALADAYRDMVSRIEPSDQYFQCGMTGTNFLGDRSLRREIIARVSAIIAPRLATTFVEHRFLCAGFRVKQTGPSSFLCMHQDPTMVDEAEQWSLNIIVPVIDVHADNGALRVLPGSHKYLPRVRSMNLNDRVDIDDMRIEDEIADLVDVLPMRAGDAIFYYNAVLHGSGVNATTEHRPFVLGTLMSQGASMVLYLRNAPGDQMIERYEVPDDFFTDLEDFERDFKLRPSVGRRLDDRAGDDTVSRAELLSLIRSNARAR